MMLQIVAVWNVTSLPLSKITIYQLIVFVVYMSEAIETDQSVALTITKVTTRHRHRSVEGKHPLTPTHDHVRSQIDAICGIVILCAWVVRTRDPAYKYNNVLSI